MVSGLGVRSQLGSKQTHQNAEIFCAINSTVLYCTLWKYKRELCYLDDLKECPRDKINVDAHYCHSSIPVFNLYIFENPCANCTAPVLLLNPNAAANCALQQWKLHINDTVYSIHTVASELFIPIVQYGIKKVNGSIYVNVRSKLHFLSSETFEKGYLTDMHTFKWCIQYKVKLNKHCYVERK